MVKVVVDSSVIIKWLNSDNENYLEEANKIITDILDGKIELIVPELAKYEVGNVLLLSKKLSSSQIKIPLDGLFSLPIKFKVWTRKLAEETFTIANDLNITFYDASFIALAKQEGAVLVTDNVKHQGKSKDIKVIPLAYFGTQIQ